MPPSSKVAGLHGFTGMQVDRKQRRQQAALSKLRFSNASAQRMDRKLCGTAATSPARHFDDGGIKVPRPRPALGISAFWAIDDTTH